MKPSILGFAVTIFLLVAAAFGRADQSASGRWEGSVQIPGRELTLVVDLAQDSHGSWIGSIIVPGLDLTGAALTEIAVKDSAVAFAIKTGRGLQATFKGRLGPEGALVGNFGEAGNTAPFSLKKTGPPQVETPPHSTSIRKELEGEWTGEYELLGYPRKVTLKLVNRGAEGAAADFVVVGKKTSKLPVDLVTQDGASLTIDSHETGISYEGRFSKASGEIKGTLIQGPIELPLVLRRAK